MAGPENKIGSTKLGRLKDVLLPPRRVLSDLRYVPLKHGLAVACALLLDVPFGNPDHVSSAFVSVMCVAPTVLLGTKRASVQFGGSLVGGLYGAAAMWAALELRISLAFAIPAAVTAAVLSVLVLRRSEAVAVAAFTALFLPAMPQGGALDTFSQRLLAICIGAASGFLVNSAVSFFGYRSIFVRRLRVANESMSKVVEGLSEPGWKRNALRPHFEMLDTIQDEIGTALAEPRWLHREHTRSKLLLVEAEIDRLRRIAHLLYDAALVVESERLEPRWLVELAGLLQGKHHLRGLPPELRVVADRLLQATGPARQ